MHIRTCDLQSKLQTAFEEVYDLQHAPQETHNLVNHPEMSDMRRTLNDELERL